VSSSTILFGHLSPFGICSGELHKAEHHAPIEVVEPALYAAMSGWDRAPGINAVLSVLLAQISRVFRSRSAKVCVHVCWGVLQNNFLRKLVHPGRPHHIHNGVVQMSTRAQPFSTYHGKIYSDRPTWMPKRAQDLDLRHDADYQLLGYSAYMYA